MEEQRGIIPGPVPGAGHPAVRAGGDRRRPFGNGREADEKFRQIKGYMRANVETLMANQIILCDPAARVKPVQIPLGSQKVFPLEVTGEGRLCFKIPGRKTGGKKACSSLPCLSRAPISSARS